MKICDLHTHSTYSDGSYTPEEIINSALDIGLSAVALCDHNTVDGLPYFLKSAENKNIQAIPGAEFSVDYSGTELHLLGLCIPENQFDKISQKMKDINARKEQSNIDLIVSLNKAGYDIDFISIKNSKPNGLFNRADIGAELTRKGYTASVQHAFDTLLEPEHGHYKEPERISVFEMVEFVKSINAVPVSAHPLLNLSYEKLEAFLPLAKEKGLIGMECFYSTYDEKMTQDSLRLADKFGLKYSGGSDFHGNTKPNIKLGFGHGNLKIPYEWLAALSC